MAEQRILEEALHWKGGFLLSAMLVHQRIIVHLNVNYCIFEIRFNNLCLLHYRRSLSEWITLYHPLIGSLALFSLGIRMWLCSWLQEAGQRLSIVVGTLSFYCVR